MKLFILAVFFPFAVYAGPSVSGGLPIFEIPKDVNFDCVAQLSVYLIKNNQKTHGNFTESFSLKEKKGSRRASGLAVSHGFTLENWKMNEAKENTLSASDMNQYFSIRHGLSIHFRWADYSKTDLVDATLYFDTKDPEEVWTTQEISLSQEQFNMSFMHKMRLENNYSAEQLTVQCKQGK